MPRFEPPFVFQPPSYKPPTVDDIIDLEVKGPWTTKSNAVLNVLLAMPHDLATQFLTYDDELGKLPVDIRGLRIYSVRGLKKGSVGGTEFHRIRKEQIIGLDGSVDLELEDVYGRKRNVVITPKRGVHFPPFILHTYTTLQDNSGLLVVANTLFNADNPTTNDSYTSDVFREIQSHYNK